MEEARLQPIEQDIAETRDRMERRLAQIEQRVKAPVERVRRAVDVPGMVRERPWVAVAVAAGAGFLAMRLMRRRGGSHELDRDREDDQELGGPPPPLPAAARRPPLRERYGEELGAIKTAAAAIAIDAAKTYLHRKLPGLAEQVAAARRSPTGPIDELDDGEPMGVG
jgi:ElaB/YqjD/DUF883 family membrane-anchored ribosome-binding protein